jgi:hypothetical protein
MTEGECRFGNFAGPGTYRRWVTRGAHRRLSEEAFGALVDSLEEKLRAR